MAVVSALDVADYIVDKAAPMSAMKLQKLVYYCQAWSLAWDEEPMFRDQIQAWANGPVVYGLFDAHRGLFTINQTFKSGGNANKLSDRQQEIADRIIEAYGPLSPQQLSDLTHVERPWRKARGNLSATASSSAVIDEWEMLDFYSALSRDAQAVDVRSLGQFS